MVPRVCARAVALWIPLAVLGGASVGGAPVLNELVVRPASGEGEWLEILNPGPERVRLEGWAVADATGKPRAIPGKPELGPGGFLLLAARPESLRAAYALPESIAVLRPSTWPVLNDRDGDGGAPADIVRLLDGRGHAADSVAYYEVWLPPEAGRSLERVDVRLPGSEPGAWAWSEDPRGATPGRPNSLGAVTELMSGDVLRGPERVAPAREAALFTFRLPGPGTLAMKLLDRDGDEVGVLREPGPAPAAGNWVWGAAEVLPPRSGLYLLCLRWQGESGKALRRCLPVWVER